MVKNGELYGEIGLILPTKSNLIYGCESKLTHGTTDFGSFDSPFDLGGAKFWPIALLSMQLLQFVEFGKVLYYVILPKSTYSNSCNKPLGEALSTSQIGWSNCPPVEINKHLWLDQMVRKAAFVQWVNHQLYWNCHNLRIYSMIIWYKHIVVWNIVLKYISYSIPVWNTCIEIVVVWLIQCIQIHHFQTQPSRKPRIPCLFCPGFLEISGRTNSPVEPLQFTGGADGAECISRLPCVPWEGDPNSEEMAAWQVWT